ncbi:MAG TPA: S53 family peptidase [Gaiellaceae bacterium]|jgi:subtilase family serine protease
MLHRIALAAAVAAASALVGVVAAGAAIQAPDTTAGANDNVTPACTTPAPEFHYAWYHCYTPSDITSAYGVNTLQSQGILGQGQTIVLVDSYGSPTAASDLQFFHDTFYPSLPNPSFEQVYPNGQPDYTNVGNGQSGSSGAAGWSGEATLDIEWSYAIAPLAHIVLIAVPPAETEGVQGFPNLFKAISDEIDATPGGTVFSMSFGVTEQTFGGAAKSQTAKLDAVFQKGIAKGDTFFASSGDNGSLGTAKQHKDTAFYSFPTDGWPASSPYVTAVGGTQLQHGWTWAPTSDVAFLASGAANPDYFASTSGGNLNAVWNESWLPAASGGGPSALYPRPSWQSGVAGVIGTNSRGVPDVAWNAAVNGGALVYITAFPQVQRSGWHVYGGTSAASPQVAALTALAAQERTAAHKAPLGNINGLLYAHPTWFTDVKPVTEGTAQSGQLVNNREWDYNGDGVAVSPDGVPGWPVLTGYDMTTGLGTPNAPAYVSGLAGS